MSEDRNKSPRVADMPDRKVRTTDDGRVISTPKEGEKAGLKYEGESPRGLTAGQEDERKRRRNTEEQD